VTREEAISIVTLTFDREKGKLEKMFQPEIYGKTVEIMEKRLNNTLIWWLPKERF